MPISQLNDSELLESTARAAVRERASTLELLEHLREVDRRRLYARRAFSSLFEYVRSLGYSEAQAAERVNAARLIASVPEAREKLETQSLSLTTASRLQRFFRQEKPSSEEKVELLRQCEGKSKREVEKLLLEISPEVEKPEGRREVAPERTELRFVVSQETLSRVERIREMRGFESLAQVFEAAVEQFAESLEKKLSKEVARPAERMSFSRYVPVAMRRDIRNRSQGQCEYTDPLTKRRCASRRALQFDHRVPFAKGGATIEENLRQLCPNHNRLAAIDEFGEKKMNPYLKGNSA